MPTLAELFQFLCVLNVQDLLTSRVHKIPPECWRWCANFVQFEQIVLLFQIFHVCITSVKPAKKKKKKSQKYFIANTYQYELHHNENQPVHKLWEFYLTVLMMAPKFYFLILCQHAASETLPLPIAYAAPCWLNK